jgi:hypothetical protein
MATTSTLRTLSVFDLKQEFLKELNRLSNANAEINNNQSVYIVVSNNCELCKISATNKYDVLLQLFKTYPKMYGYGRLSKMICEYEHKRKCIATMEDIVEFYILHLQANMRLQITELN